MFEFLKYHRGIKKRSNGKWSKSVAEYMQEQGKFIANENLSKRHIKIKHPELFKK